MSNTTTPWPPRDRIRVLLADLPTGLTKELQRAIMAQPDLLLVDGDQTHPADRADLLLAVANDVDVLVLGAAKAYPPPGVCSHLLSEFPEIKIVVAAHEDDAAITYCLGLRRRRLGQVSASVLLSGIRQARDVDGSV